MSPPPPDQLEISYPDGAVRLFVLDPARGVTNIGRHPRNDIVLDGAAIKPFHMVVDHRQRPSQLIAVRQLEGASQELTFEHLGDLQPLDTIEMGGYRLRLLSGQRGPSTQRQPPPRVPPPPAAAAPPPAMALPPTRPAHATDAPLRIEPSARLWLAEVGRTVFYRLRISNLSPYAVSCVLLAEGEASPWLTLTPATLELGPWGETTIQADLAPPKLPSSRAGEHALQLVAMPLHQPDHATRESVTVRVPPFYAFSVGPIVPPRQALPPLRSHAHVTLPMSNLGNCDTSFRVEASATGGNCRFDFQVPGEVALMAGQAEVRLAAGETLALPVRVTPPEKPLIGTKKYAYHIALGTTMLAEKQPRRAVGALLVTSPPIGPLPIVLLAFCLMMLAAVAAPRWLPRPAPPASAVAVAPTEARTLEEALLAEVEAQEFSDWLDENAVFRPTPEPTMAAVALATDLDERMQGAIGPLTYEQMFKEIGDQYDIDWQLLASVAYKESGINPLALGRSNDMGLMQIIPSTWDQIAPPLGVSDPYDPYSNALAGAAFLAYLRDYFSRLGYPQEQFMLVAYNWGPSNVEGVLRNNGGWLDIPEARRDYAVDIINARFDMPAGMLARLQQFVE